MGHWVGNFTKWVVFLQTSLSVECLLMEMLNVQCQRQWRARNKNVCKLFDMNARKTSVRSWTVICFFLFDPQLCSREQVNTHPGLHFSRTSRTSVAQLPTIIPARIHLFHCLVLICVFETFTAWQLCLVGKLQGKQTRPHNTMPFNEAWVVLQSNSLRYNLCSPSVKQHPHQNELQRSAYNHHLHKKVV